MLLLIGWLSQAKLLRSVTTTIKELTTFKSFTSASSIKYQASTFFKLSLPVSLRGLRPLLFCMIDCGNSCGSSYIEMPLTAYHPVLGRLSMLASLFNYFRPFFWVGIAFVMNYN
jgi:hypothetical protein